MLKKIPLLTFLVFTIAAIFTVLNEYGVFTLAPEILAVIRWAAIAMLVLFAFRKRSLTTWILTSMVIGAEIGYDFPQFAQSLNVFSKIFLKLVKTIIAPLVFATLVVGIAGHSNLKQVGKMGLKAIVYFEIVTTIALVLGLIAINVSKAGVGIVYKGEASEEIAAPANKPFPILSCTFSPKT